MPSPFTFVALGVGDAFSARHYSSCLLLEADGVRLMVDCPHPVRKVLREGMARLGEHLDLPDLLGTLVTHLHADHAAGLEGYGFYCHFIAQVRPVLVAHPDTLHQVWHGQLKTTMGDLLFPEEGEAPERALHDYFEPIALEAEGATQVGPFSITWRKTRHLETTTALKIRAGGRCLGISSDTRFDPELIAWLDDADVIIHEANHDAHIHTPVDHLGALAPDVRARLRLTHLPDELVIPDGLVALQEGVRYDVGA